MKAEELIKIVVKSEGVDKVTVDFDKLAKGIKEIELEAKDAKASIRGLKDENKDMSAEVKRLEKVLKDGEKEWQQYIKTGSSASDAAQNLRVQLNRIPATIDKLNSKIQQNNETIKQAGYVQEYLARNTKITDMTMSQLSQRAAYLRAKLNNLSQSLDKDDWKKYNNELIKVEAQQKKVAIGGENVKSRFDSIGNTIKKVMPLMIAYGALRIFQNMISGAVEWMKAAPEVAAKAEGVARAFNKIDNPNLLSTLRRETKGLISDLGLMTQAVRAEKFGIPINDLAKYLKFAQQRAQETGQSVDYLAESIINGIGRKSKLIIDNLGISASRLNSEIKKGASFAQSVTKIVDEELGKQGDLTLTAADKAQQAAVKWENAQLKVGKSLTWVSNKWNEFSGKVADGVASLAGDSKTASQAFDDQAKKVAQLEVNILPLIDRYDKLKKEVKLTYGQSKELDKEHKEMLDLVGKITTAMPHLRTEFDQYGRAIGFSTDEARKFIETQKAIMPYLYAKQLEDAKSNVEDYTFQIKLLKAEIAKGGTGSDQIRGGMNAYASSPRGFSAKELAEKNAQLAEFSAKLGMAERAVAYFEGNTSETYLKGEQKIVEKENEFKQMTDVQLESWIKSHKNAKDQVTKDSADFIKTIADRGFVVKTYLNDIGEAEKEFNGKQTTSVELSLKKQLELAQQIYDQRFGNLGDEGKDEKESKIVARQKEELKARLENLETAHKYELIALKKNSIEKGQTEGEYQKVVLDSENQYYSSRIGVYDKFVKDFKVTNKKFNEDIKAGRADTQSKQTDLLPQFDTNRLATLQKNRDEQLRVIEITKNAQLRALQEQEESEEIYAVKSQAIELSALQLRLGVLNEYNAKVVESEFTNGKLKLETVREAGDALVVAEAETIQKRKDLEKKFRESNYNVRSQYGLTSVDEDKNRDLKVFQDLLATNRINYETYQKLLTQLNAKYESERIQVKEKYGVATWGEQRQAELDAAKEDFEKGLLAEEEFAKAQFNIKMKWAKQYFDYFKDLSSNLITSLMEAETAKLDAEYDVRIEAAKGNAEEVERLENEKAQKKLEIEKKYADVQFAVKASEIIANTAVAIMTGFSQLGPIAGAVAAVMLGVTGAAQLAAANAERQKVKNMTLGGSSSSSSKSARIVAGKQDGGHIDVEREQDGKRFDAIYDPDKRGFVDRPTVIVGEGPIGQSKEWVASNALVGNPTSRPIIDLLDQAQRSGRASTIDINRLARARMAGFETGGFFSQRQQARPLSGETRNTPSVAQRPSVVEIEMLELLRHLNAKGVKAIVGVTELEAEKKLKEDIDSKFTM